MPEFEELLEAERYELRESLPYQFRLSRRELLEIVGAGLFIVAIQPAFAQRGQSATGSVQGRLHAGEDGFITIFTGKIEEGQGARTELAMAAAEELRLPVQRIRVAMADTDVSPNDGTTAGSRTTPSTVPAVRRAAAAAREILVGLAAEQLQAPRERIRIVDGAAIGPDPARKLTYADLARSPELAKAQIPPDVHVLPSKNWQTLGRPVHRVNGSEIVTGAHKFPSDIERPGMLYGCVLRPPSYEATLVSLKPEAGKTANGVTVVHDGQFAGCAAPTSFLARKAVEALAATAHWKEKQHPSSSTLFDHLKEHAQIKKHAQTGQTSGRNQPKIKGDVEQALAGAGKRLQASYRAAYVQHAPMEPRAAVAEWQDGKLTVWTGSSNPFSVREQLAQTFRLSPQQVRVIVPDFGGGFGGKHTGEAAIEAARLAREAGKPVSLRWTRAEEFTWAYFRPAALIEVSAALDAQKRILAWDFVNYNSGGSAIDTPYRTLNSRIRFLPSQSPLRQGSYRALASTANNFARECFIDELAAEAGMDPLEFRLAHLENDRIREVLVAATRKFDWDRRRKNLEPNRGVGLACGTEKNSVVAACVEVEVDPRTGTPALREICEAFECGAVLNPAGLQAQVEGCIMMGLGAALREEIQFASGKITNPRFSAYRVPRFADCPRMDIVLVDKKDAEPVGAGETPIIAVAPAIANAVFTVTGRRLRSLPFASVVYSNKSPGIAQVLHCEPSARHAPLSEGFIYSAT